MTDIPLSHNYVVAKIDKLVNDILSPSSRISIQQVSTQLNSYYQPMTLLFNDELEYSNSITWFMSSCYLVCGDFYADEVVWDEALTKRFLSELDFYQYEFATNINDFAFQEWRNSKSLSRYMSHYLNEYARVLIVRVDLKIKIDFSHLVDAVMFNSFMNKLMDKIQRDREKAKRRKTVNITSKSKSCFEDLRGYAWAIEQGVETGGLHCHLLLIYNGDKRISDWFLSDAVGKEWVKITDGLGNYYNCNTTEHKRAYARHGTLGIGMIHKNNTLEVNNAMKAALYLTRSNKYEQRLKSWLPNMRSFGRGTYPKN